MFIRVWRSNKDHIEIHTGTDPNYPPDGNREGGVIVISPNQIPELVRQLDKAQKFLNGDPVDYQTFEVK